MGVQEEVLAAQVIFHGSIERGSRGTIRLTAARAGAAGSFTGLIFHRASQEGHATFSD